MAGSITLILVGVMVLSGGEWPAAYPVACILAGAAWWHLAEHVRRVRLAGAAPTSRRLAAARRTLAAFAAIMEVAAILIAAGSVFDHRAAGLSANVPLAVVVGAALLYAAAQLNAFRLRLSEAAVDSWLRARRAAS